MARTKTPTRSAAPQGVSLHLGLNLVDPAHYGGWSGELAACEFDANDMAAIARSQGMKPIVLLTKKATRAAVLRALTDAARTLKAGDLFFLSFSGHGGQVPDASGEEADKQDETWCLYDAQLIDDELYFALSRFAAGVRILVLSDSCHSGTVTRAGPLTTAPLGVLPEQRPRLMPHSVALRTYRDHRGFYDKLQADLARAAGEAPVDPDEALANVAVSNRLTAIVDRFEPAVILISGCQDNQTSMDGANNGAFTEQLLAVWRNGAFRGSYASFHAQIRMQLPPTQSPNLFTLGPAARFVRQPPFSV